LPDNDPRISLNRSHPGADAVYTVTAGLAAIRKSGDAEDEQVNELRFGDSFTVYEQSDGYGYGQSGRDDYVGYVRLGQLSRAKPRLTHRVKNSFTFLFPEASIKAPVLDRLPMLSRVEVIKEDERFAEIKGGGFVHREHLAKVDEALSTDPVDAAMRFMDAPYLWGGISPLGCDCSGLIQAALEACGIRCPRDSDMQTREVGQVADQKDLKRGDIVCFKGHIGFMADAVNLLHANAFHGRVVVEPLAEVVDRGSAVTALKRL
jgi:hypothetical protein